MNQTPKSKSLGSVGGAGGSAKAGGYNQGNALSGNGNFTGAVAGIQQNDLRGGNAKKASGYNQGSMSQQDCGCGGNPPCPDLRGGTSKVGSGYNQGAQK